jgi:hypothetical protein
MRINIFIFILISIVGLGGCYYKTATYENFKYKRECYVDSHIIPKGYYNRREIYSEDKYIYKFKGDDPRCVYAYLTNRDDTPEKVLSWFIISGKEFCKETPGVGEVI